MDSFYLTTILQVIFSFIDLFLALVYSLPIIFISRFHRQNNMFILNLCITIIIGCIYYIVYFLMGYFEPQILFAPNMCILLLYAYNIAGIAIPFTFLTFTVHRFCSIVYHTQPFFRKKRWVGICIASQWVLLFVISLPFIFRNGPYCSNELWMRIYTCVLSVVVPTLINTILNIMIFIHVRSSSRRINPRTTDTSINTIAEGEKQERQLVSRRELALLRQMTFTFVVFITGWFPIFAVIIISYFINIDSTISAAFAMVSQLCILSIIINLFIYNHELKEYLLNKIQQVIRF